MTVGVVSRPVQYTWCVFAVLMANFSLLADAGDSPLTVPAVANDLGAIAKQLNAPGITVLKPDKDEAEWWAGAPSVVRDRTTYFDGLPDAHGRGRAWVARHEVRVLRSADGEHSRRRRRSSARRPDSCPSARALIDPATGKFKLHARGPWKKGRGRSLSSHTASPAEFAASTAKPVIVPREKTYERDQPPVEYKDPVIIHADGKYHCYVIGYVRKNERIFHFASNDGETWEPVGNPYEPIMALSGWHDFFVRPASVVPTGAGYLFIYEGSKTSWHDPVHHVATRIAYTFDLRRIIDLTPDAPLAVSATPTRILRHSLFELGARRRCIVGLRRSDRAQRHEIRLYKPIP